VNAHVPIGDLFGILLPLDCANGSLAMLTAYFDDAGTHDGGKWGPSKIVAVAGIFGTEAELRGLEPIREVWIHNEAFAASRLSMMRIMARRTKAATVVA
jgi:hypothetical protein